MSASLAGLTGFVGEFGTTTEAKLVLSATIALVAFVSAYVVNRARKALSERIAPLAVDVAGAVLSVGVVAGAAFSIAVVWEMTEDLVDYFGLGDIGAIAPQIAVTVVVLIAIQVFTSIARRLLNDIERESNAVSEHERELIYRLTMLTLWAIGAVAVLGVWEVDLSGLLVGAGFLGIVLGLAAQKTLGSLFGGLVLMFSKPFEVGDWIAVGTDGDEGIVTDITIMNTRIQAFDGEYIVVPNDVISSRTIRNRSQKGRLRIEVEVGIDYDADVEHARAVVLDVVEDLDIVMDVPRPECITKSFDDSAVTLAARGWIEHPSSRRRWRTKTQMIRSIKAGFAEEGIKIPFPQRELGGRAEQGGFRVVESTPDQRPSQDDASPQPTGTGDDDLSDSKREGDASKSASEDDPSTWNPGGDPSTSRSDDDASTSTQDDDASNSTQDDDQSTSATESSSTDSAGGGRR